MESLDARFRFHILLQVRHFWLVSLVSILPIAGLFAQPFPIFNGTAVTCIGAFLDSGGQGASGYSNNENITYTLCPDVPGGAISLNFLTFNLSTAGAAPIDFMTIYDGNSTAAPVLANWTGSAGQGQVVSASAGNSSGCLTIVFRSNNTGTGVFAASITCYQPCARPTAVATHGAAGPRRICPGQIVTFNSTGSFAAPGFNVASRRWDFGDGTILNNAPAIVNHTYAQPGGYMAQLYLLDNNGCASTNLVDLLVEVGTQPTFPGTGGALSGCAGETLCLNGAVTGTTWTEDPSPSLGGGVFLPDNVGQCFESTITFNQFPAGATLNNVNGLLTICMDIEHSFLGDLIINIISPTGQTVTLHQQGGGGTFLGNPVDNDLTPNAQGTCWNYCWSPTAGNGTMAANGGGGTLPSGTYQSLNSLAGLVGSQLNGTWTFQVCDMWASDNGFLCNWALDFNPSLFDDLITFTPIYGAQCDSSYWTGPSITSTSANCNQICVTPPAAGNFSYVYHVTDNFGCSYDTTLTVNIVPAPQVNAGPDASTCNTPVQLGASVTSGGFPTNCTYTLTLYDSFGDGWTGLFGLGSNGSNVTITVNGVPASYWLPNGAQGSVTIPVTAGATIVLNYTAGNLYNGEQSFTLFNSTGGIVYASPQGPGSGLAWSGVANCPGGNFVYSWTPAAGLSDPNIANPTATVGGTTQYCVTVYQQGHPACTTTDCMTITVDNLVDPGTNANVAACSNGAAITLFAQLGGTPTAGGTWTAPGGGAHSGTFTPGADAPGIYTYTVGGAGACGAPQSSTVNVTVYPLPDAGTPTSLAVCSTDAAQSLFALLGAGAQAGGAWSGPSPVAGGNYNPATMNPGVYTYTVNGTAPCPNATATVTVTESAPPNAGTDANITLCSTSAPVVMVTQLGGSPDGTGSWTAPGGGASSGGLDPAVDPPGIYTYTVTGTAPCPNDVATLTVAVNQAPNAGTNGAIALCGTDAPASLFAQLGGTPDAGGAWNGPSPVVGGMIDPATMSAGVYTYTVNGIAPCPNEQATVTVTINPPPDPGTNGAITLCTTDVPASLFAQLGGAPDAGGTWSGPSPVVGGMIDPATMSVGVYTYTLAGTAPCPDESATVTVTINTPPHPGTNGAITLCSADAPASLFAQLGGTPDGGGSWSGPSPVVGGMIDPATMNAGVYTYTVTGTAPCPDETATVTVTINTPPDPGTLGAITLCSTDAPASLFAQLGGTPDGGGSWSGPSPVVGGMIDPATMNAGVYTYTVTGTAPCPDETATVTVTINTPPDPGTLGAITLCSTDAPASLFAQLGGTPDVGGTWSGPSAVVGGMIDPATMSAGVYTYTVNGIAPCPSEQATVTVTINTLPDPGTDGAITLCSSDAPASLFAQLGGTPDGGGTWNGPSSVVGGMIDPATMSAGVYTYTVNGIAPCPSEQATVTVTINTLPDPGTDGAITLCSSDAPASLFAQLGGTPDGGGTWNGPSPVVGGMIDPATMSAGVYIYTILGTAPCPDEQATVTVTINLPPDPGTPGAITLCSTDAPTSLFAQLGGTPAAGGTWSGPSPVVGGMIDPATMSAGVYIYNVTGTTPCPDETVTVTVTINTPPDPGTNEAITLCSTDAPASLFAELGGTPEGGGSWSGPSPVVGGMIDPATMNAGVYTYTVTGTAPCADDAATVTVTINAPPDPGTPGAITLCSTDAPASLFAQLGGTPDIGGTWSGPSAVVGGMIDPATMSAGVYTYTVTGTAPCPDESASVTVTINTPPDPGTPGAITLCSSDAPVSLFAQLGGTPDLGGTWSGPSPVAGGIIDPATMSAGVYTYTMNGIAPCVNGSSTVTVTINAPPNAGTDGSITLCTSSATVSLFTQLGGSPQAGGTWSGPSAVVGGVIDPASMNEGVYTYTVVGAAPCPNATATVTVTINPMPDAGLDGGLTLCSSSPATGLITGLNGTPDPGGTWTAPGGGASTGTFTPGVSATGFYTYTVNGIAPCPAVSATVDVNVVTNPDAGTPGSATLCASDAAILLFDELGGTPDAGGNWSGPSPVVGGQYDPATMNPGVYTYTIVVPPPCVNASSTVTITEVAPPNAGTDGAITLCISSPAASMFAALGGGAQAGGNWSGPSPVVGGMFNPATMTAGVYSYTVNGTAPCPNDQSQVTVNVVAAPDAGTPGSATLCSTDAAIDLFAELGGTPDLGGAWSGPSAVAGGQYDPASMNPGVYTYTIAVPPPCVNASSTVTIIEIAPPNAGIDSAITLCISSPAASLFAALGGGAQAGGSWSGPSPVVGGMFDPATMSAGAYTYTVTGTTPCPNDQSTVTVNVVAAPDAGTPGNATLCATDAAIDLFAELGGTPDLGGAWNGPSAVAGGQYDPATMNPGVYTYTITVPPPCVNASSTVTIIEVAPPNAGTDGALTLCISSPAASLFSQLGGGAQAGGTWSGPSPVAGGMFDPATMTAGVYTYTLTGTAPCANDQSAVTVNVVAAPDAGTPGSATLCATDASISLFGQLGGTPDSGGNWSGPSAVAGAMYDPTTMNPGVYTYTIVVPPPCVNANSTVTITEIAPPNAGTDGAITLCISSPATSLFAQLGGGAQAGGSWSGPSPVAGGMFDPAMMTAGAYTYTVSGTTPCPNDQSIVTVTVVSEPNPGGPGFLTICASDAPDNLYSYLEGSPDQGGVWTTPSGAATSGTFNPATMTAGVYTYTIAVPPPCTSVSSTVTVDVVAAPDAGQDGAGTLCLTGAPLDLFTVLGGTPQAGGNWTSNTGAPFGGTFDPAADTPGVFNYTVNGTAPCPADVASVTIAVTQLPNAGSDAILNLCIVGDPVDLFGSLGGADIGGTWSGPSGASSGVFSPGVSTAGNYTYSVAGSPPCPSASATVSVNVLSSADAGVDGETTLCGSDGAVALYSLLQGGPDAGGSWFDPSGIAMNGTFNPGTNAAGAYTYILYVPAPCVNDTSQVLVSVVAPVNAGTNGTATLCSNSPPIALITALGGSPDPGGAWTGPGGAFEGTFTPQIDPPGAYTYTVTATAPCPNQSATVDVAVNPLPDAGLNGSITLCPEAASIQLFTLLGGTPMTGGTWTGPGGAPSDGIFDPASSPQGVYTYTVTGLLPCPNASASSTATVFLIAPPNAGPDVVTCTLEHTLNAIGNWASGTWSGPTGITFGDPTSPSSSVTAIAGGAYTLTWSVLSNDGCATLDQVIITFTDAIVPVVTATDAICNGACNGTASVAATGGNGAFSFAWSNGIAGNTPSATGICAGSYTVTVFDANNCSATTPFIIGEPEALVIDAIASVNETCPGSCDGSITITDPEGVLYSINGGASYQAGNMFMGLCPGQYAIVMQDANGCTASGSATILRPAPVVADFTYSPGTLTVSASTAQFTNTSTPNAVTFTWDFSVGTSTAASPAFTFPGGLGDTYMVCLTAYDANGCADTHCEPIEVLDDLVVWVPNAFTPNGDDENDSFMPVFNLPHLVRDYEFMIFDRWGLLLNRSERVHEPWSGEYQGELVQLDVYVWKMKCYNRLTNELIERVGHVTVLK
ncbi:MAG: gliding motility-associated C-terminal domain-containing protein [Flavobacteriales bacterium]|nr:gliding motility-associated C-terminal domain-containing protein [Flavobacteriales bacterium]